MRHWLLDLAKVASAVDGEELFFDICDDDGFMDRVRSARIENMVAVDADFYLTCQFEDSLSKAKETTEMKLAAIDALEQHASAYFQQQKDEQELIKKMIAKMRTDPNVVG